MNGRSVVGYVSALALATGAAVIGQNQPSSTPARQPAATQPSSTPRPATAQPSKTGDQMRWRDMAAKIQDSHDRMAERNQKLAQQLAQAQTQTGEARVNAIAEVLTGVLQEQEYTTRAITHLQRLVFRNYLDSSNMSNEWDTWKDQYPFLDDAKDTGDDAAGNTSDQRRDRSKDTTNPDTTTPPRNPR